MGRRGNPVGIVVRDAKVSAGLPRHSVARNDRGEGTLRRRGKRRRPGAGSVNFLVGAYGEQEDGRLVGFFHEVEENAEVVAGGARPVPVQFALELVCAEAWLPRVLGK